MKNILIAVVLALFSSIATASGSSTIVLDQPPPIVFGETVTFTFVTTVPYPLVNVSCVQNGYHIYYLTQDALNPSPGTPAESPPFMLGPTASWTSGGADCTATLLEKDIKHRGGGQVFFVYHTLATTSFVVSP